ncbi:hypothetical protein TGDOM2_244715 [Toxoplasma gondii GAB2-2007-GAL-DOM2]|uniref:Transmembrane protein n=1 Tax=Toxoplasma gondii GAB2-2007-GAL-DOM2 TaxID=1130820 RepID=A0A086JWI1_TOXGO|nr:hypothetical protein TGDOM2_244715 [Toxoplasma gondii GAB2-2007-GAL-DOM2]
MQNNAGTRPGVTEARSPRYSGSGQDSGAHAAETNSNGKPHAATNEEDLHQLEGGAKSEKSPEDNTGCLRHSSGIWIEPESRSDGSSLFAAPAPKGVTAPVPPTTPRQTRLLPKQPIAVKKDTTARARAIDADAMASSAAREGRKETSLSLVRPAQAPQRRQGILQRQEKGRSTGNSDVLTPRRWGIWMWITLCICFGVVVFYLQTSHANAAFCCYPRYLEYCLELVEEKFAVVEEKLEMLMEFADSINKKRSSEEERRLASLDWMVKEVLKVQLSDFDVTVQRSKGIFYEDRWLTVRCISDSRSVVTSSAAREHITSTKVSFRGMPQELHCLEFTSWHLQMIRLPRYGRIKPGELPGPVEQLR